MYNNNNNKLIKSNNNKDRWPGLGHYVNRLHQNNICDEALEIFFSPVLCEYVRKYGKFFYIYIFIIYVNLKMITKIPDFLFVSLYNIV